MNNTIPRQDLIARRGELLAELLLQDFKPEFVARAASDFTYDFLIGFLNPEGGINNVAVKVKATERLNQNRFPVARQQYERWANSNIPVLILVVDVKENRIFYAWPTPETATAAQGSQTISLHLTEMDDNKKAELRTQLTKTLTAVPGNGISPDAPSPLIAA